MNTYLAIDQGTHASRAILYDHQGRQIAQARQNVAISRFDNGRVEQNPQEIVNSARAVINQVIASNPGSISACGIATQRSTVLAWHEDGTPISPALSWQDVRGAALIEDLQIHEAEIRQISGLPLSPYYGASKLRWLLDWLADNHGKYDQLRLSPLTSFMIFHLLETHPFTIDHGNAQRTQLMDLATLNWSPQLLEWFQVPETCLPQCSPICCEYGLLASTNIPVLAVNGDQNAAFFGAGELPPDSVLINLGSGAFILRDIGPAPKSSPYQLTGIAYSDSRRTRYLREATINGAGNALDWAQTKWGIKHLYQQLSYWLEQVKDPPVFINTIGGLGSPWWRDNLEPKFMGDDHEFTIDRRVVAIVESIGFMIQANLELMNQEAPISKLYVSGGLANVDALCQLLANLTQLAVERLVESETTARGIAWLAAGRPEDWRLTVTNNLFTPRPDPGLELRYRQFCHFLEQYRQ